MAKIAIRVILTMRLFAHCDGKAKDVMVGFSNRCLAANANRAANREPPMSYDEALNKAGNACYSRGFAREPPPLQQFLQHRKTFQTAYQAPNYTRGASGTVQCAVQVLV